MSQPERSQFSASDARRTVRNTGILILASIISKGILFAWQIILGAWLGPFDYGIYNTVLGALAIVTPIASFGMGVILIRDAVRNREKIEQYRAAALWMQTILTLLAYLLAIGGALLAGYSESIVVFTAIAGLSLFVDLYGNLHNDLLLVHERMFSIAVVDISHTVLRIGLAALALFAGFGLFGVYAATIFTGILRSAILFWLSSQDGLRLNMRLDRSLAQMLFINSLPLALNAVLKLSYDHIDKLMTTGIIGERSTGFLGPAFVINYGITELLNTSILVALFPLMARIYDDGKNPLFGLLTEKLARFTLIFSLPVALVLSIFSYEIIALIYPPEFAPTGGILRIFVWYTTLAMLSNVFAQALIMQNRQRTMLMIKSSGLVLNISLNTFLLTQFRDPRGAAVASIITECLVITLLLWQFRATGFESGRNIPSLLRLAMFTVVAGAVMVLLREQIVLAIPAGAIIYLVGMFFGGVLQADDFDLLYRLVAAMPGGSLILRYWRRDITLFR